VVTLNDNECKLLSSLLERFSNVLSNEGCNDYEIEDNPENREFLINAGITGGGLTLEESRETVEKCAQNGKIITQDFMILGYFEQIFRNNS